MRTRFLALLALSLTALLALSVSADSKPAKRGAESHQRANVSRAAKNHKSLKPNVQTKRANSRAAQHDRRPMAAIVRVEDDGSVNARHVSISALRHRPAFGWPALVTEARKYMGTNPTKRSKLWCATFMNMVLARVGYPGTGSDAARSFASYGRRIHEPKIGAIAVLTRGKSGGHVGIVTGLDGSGNPIILSGNHGRKVGIGVYPRRRVIAYVMPVGDPSPTRLASLSGPGSTLRATDAPRGNAGEEGGISSPIGELLAAINAEEQGDNRAAAQPRPRVQITRVEPQRAVQQVQRPMTPHRVVQQIADNERVQDNRIQVNYVRPVPAAARQVYAVAPSRKLPLDPALARLLGVKQR
ncbi:MAG: TIGR02594 family protein [Xanthobacteraceae bacterium]|uniref:TIGR02594 family protein n=1 Tax=Pseudolabrys sp. TaxID=1960880 RepID=UPI003D107EDD